MIKIVLAGALGRMGQALAKAVEGLDTMEIVLGLDTIVEGGMAQSSYPIVAEMPDHVAADVIVSYLPASALDALAGLVAHDIPIIVCTTGLTQDMLAKITQAAEKKPVFLSGNMSLGVTAMCQLLKDHSKFLYDNGFDIEIVESHHNQKLDAPSGTAEMLFDVLQESVTPDITVAEDRRHHKNKRQKEEIAIHSIRGGTIVGEHKVIFAGQHETIEITHKAQSREVFVEGTVKAIGFLYGKPPGLYNMEDIVCQTSI